MRSGPRRRNEVREETTQLGFKLPVSMSRAIRDEAEARRRSKDYSPRYNLSDFARDVFAADPAIAKRMERYRKAMAIAV